MSEWWDVGMVGRLNVGIAGCRNGGMSEWRDVGMVGCRTGGISEWVLPPIEDDLTSESIAKMAADRQAWRTCVV